MPTLSGPLSLGSDTQLLGTGPLVGTAPLLRTGQLASPELLPGTRPLPAAAPLASIWFLTWPLVLTMVLNLVVSLIETVIAGQFSPQAQAATGLAMQVIFLLNAPATALSIGAQVVLARSHGENPEDLDDALIRRVLRLGSQLSLVMIPVVWILAPWAFAAMGATGEVQEQAVDYLRLMLPGLLPMNLAMVINGVFRARGDMFLRLVNTAVEALVWIGGAVILGSSAGLGLGGMGLAFLAGKTASLAVAWSQIKGLGLLPRRKAPSPFDPPLPSWSPAEVRRVLRVGYPVALQNLLRPLGCMAVFAILGGTAFPATSAAAYTVGSRIETSSFLLVFALNVAAATFVGQCLGAGDPRRAERACWQMTHLATGSMAVVGLAMFIGAEGLASLFTSDPRVIAQTGDYLRIQAISEPFLAIATVLSGALQGAGSTRSPLFIALGTQFAIGLPVAYLLAQPLGLGSAGVWWALALANISQGVLVYWWFRRGNWRHKTV
ncbi:MATE family efflux transporter [bacterium]|nr:MATE family efflux transporter [bacterium]